MGKNTSSPQIEWLNGIGLAAKQLCSLVYVSGLEPTRAKSLYIDPILAPFALDLTTDYDSTNRRVTVTSLGSYAATAEMRDGLGCTLTTRLENGSQLPEVELPPVQSKPLRQASPERFANAFDKNAVEDALERAFTPEHHTLAVAVLHRGELVAERYATETKASTVLPGWSMAKSVTATLVGLLVERGRLDIHRPGIVPEWRSGTDGRESVTLDHLLRMTSGLDVVEDQSGADPNSRMLFVEHDAAAYAANRGTKHLPVAHWEYMSGSTVLACKAIFEAAGGTLESSQRFYREAFIKPLGAASFVLETDAAGTFIGSSYVLATAHDWAKFGQLYLNDGVWQGERLLPKGWVEYVTRHTPESGANSYGAGFWTVEHSNLDDLPQDTFYANGFQGQYVIVIPSRSLVIVRLGASVGPDGIWQMVDDLVSAMNQDGSLS
jgi:CubicO group peptidase (beta-lactamase class C family)